MFVSTLTRSFNEFNILIGKSTRVGLDIKIPNHEPDRGGWLVLFDVPGSGGSPEFIPSPLFGCSDG
eukprot:10565627-Alexandrium_andersonii.AAC.1